MACDGYHHPIYSPDSGQAFSDSYQSAPSGHTHQRRVSTPSDYSSHGQNYEGVRGHYRELEAQARGPKDFLQDSGGYAPDSAESGSTDADTYDTMQAPVRAKKREPHSRRPPISTQTQIAQLQNTRGEILEELQRMEGMKQHYSEQLHAQTALLNKIDPKESEEVNATIQKILKDMHHDLGAPEQNEEMLLDLRTQLEEVDQRLRAFSDHHSAFQPVTSPPNSQVSGHEGSHWSSPHADMEAEHYMSDGQYPHPSQGDSGIFGTDGSDANHSTMSQKGHHYSRPPPSTERRNPFPEFPPSFRPKLHTSVSVEDHLGSDDILENIPFTNSRPTYKRRYPTHTLSQQEAHEWRHPFNIGSPASLSQSSHPSLRQQYLEGGHIYRKQTGSPASSDSSSCYNSANERLRSAPGSVISFPGSSFSSSTASSLNSSRSGSKGILPRPSVTSHYPSGPGNSRHHYHHPSIPEFVRKTKSDVPNQFPQYHQRSYESESPEDDTTSMPNLPAVRKPNPVRPAPPPPQHRENREGQHPNIKYRQKKQIDRIPEEGRNRESLKMKLDMLIHVIKMFSSKTGKENDKDAANLLLALSRTAETVEVMHQSACLNMLIQIIHNIEHKDDREHHDVRLRATETLRNIVESKTETRQGKHDLCVLSVLEKIRCHCDELFSFISVHPTGQRISPEDHDSLQASCDAVLNQIRKLYKFSNDKEKYRGSIISLGGLQAAAEVLIVNFRLLAVQKKASGARHASDKKICHSSKIVTVIISILINLTCGDVNNKSTLCACRDFLKALVYHVSLQNESIIASAAQVLRNLSWRATPDIKDALLYYNTSVALMGAVDHCSEEATIQYITSALWNMSAHSLESRERISSAPHGLLQLVNLLSYNSPSGTTSVVENVGGILKNLSVVIKDERYRKRFREAGGLAKLAKHLKSKNKTVLANATGILWNLSAHHYEDQKILWDLGCIPLLDIHRTSEHKSIRENARGALRNLLAFGQNNGWCSRSDVMGYNLKTQKGLSKSLSIAASYTFNHLIQPQTQKHSSESLNSKSAIVQSGRSKSTGHKGSTSSLSQPKSSDHRHHHQHALDQDDHDFGGAVKSKNKDRLKFTRIASAPQSSSITNDMTSTDYERYGYTPYGQGGSKHSMDSSYPDDQDYLEDHGYPEAPDPRTHMQRPPVKQDSRSSGLSPYGYSYSQEIHGLPAVMTTLR